MFGKLGLPELILILVIALMIFGPSKLPEIGKSIGRGIREFKNASREIKESMNEESQKEKEKEQAKSGEEEAKLEEKQQL